ncbi:hypothetical protein SKAU_G00271930 [Synaphobranchus kaupii]|uniref:Uncharacterized protein n=1 Tax=Synaphobranchus kaupii TaxID=118154 RepID=A0A9Q1F0R9_SYNKA|nr:hypothetical protein SKAU_G00271930 [Synaphobranchus kaupii]
MPATFTAEVPGGGGRAAYQPHPPPPPFVLHVAELTARSNLTGWHPMQDEVTPRGSLRPPPPQHDKPTSAPSGDARSKMSRPHKAQASRFREPLGAGRPARLIGVPEAPRKLFSRAGRKETVPRCLSTRAPPLRGLRDSSLPLRARGERRRSQLATLLHSSSSETDPYADGPHPSAPSWC